MTKDEAKEKIINDFCKCRVWCELYPDMCQTESCEIWWALKALSDRPQGEWIYGEHNVAMCDGYRCNRCDFFVPWDYEHKFIDFINDYHYCPSCGARMKGADDETIRTEDI